MTESEIDDLVARCLEGLEDNDTEVVDRVCREHPNHAATIRSRVERIAGMGLVRTGSGEDDAPAQIGPYRVLEALGRGGMGTVYLAEQREPVRRRVALKVIKLGMDTREVIRRFEAERQALALMNHANIARVFDAGRTDEGRPFFAMEFVAGTPITDYCDRHRMPTEARIELMLPICEAVQHAHVKGIIHRDLKPSNILVSTGDEGRPEPKIIDFGIAKATHHDLTEGTLHTSHGQLLGTPEYMSPEQAAFQPYDIDTRTDVYSLGVVLYELLTGALPFDARALRSAQPSEMFRILQEEQAPAPSTRFRSGESAETVAAARATDAVSLHKRLRGDLDWIVLKALEKERSKRYPTALQLAADLRRHLEYEPVLARPPSRSYRLAKFVRKHRASVTASVLLLLALVAGVIGTTWGMVRAGRLAEREAKAREELERSQQRYRLLAVVPMLAQAVQDAQRITPPWPVSIPRFEQWLRDYGEPLAARRNDVARVLDEMRSRHGKVIDDMLGSREGIDHSELFLYDRLRHAKRDLARFFDQHAGEYEDMRQRLAWARVVAERTVDAHREAWRDTIRGLREDPKYGLTIPPQMGLVPLGRDPQSGLYEFAHVRSGEPAVRDPKTGALRIEPDTGLVFVLVPPGTFEMGSQKQDETKPRFEPRGVEWEGPVHTVGIPKAYFLSKYEMTKGQWFRLSRGQRPSYWRAGNEDFQVTDQHPVEQVSWQECHDVLMLHFLIIPTEAQWEYACRAGTGTRWWTGDEHSSLVGAANLADRNLAKVPQATPSFEWSVIDDGHALYAPVDTMKANPWGFHHMHGNVWEWTLDFFLEYTHRTTGPGAQRVGIRGRVPKDARRVYRGGAFNQGPYLARSAMRWSDTRISRKRNVGIRPARRVVITWK